MIHITSNSLRVEQRSIDVEDERVMNVTSKSIKIISILFCVIIALVGCTNTEMSKETFAETNISTNNQATIQSTVSQTEQLQLDEKDFPTVKLDSNVDGESLLYEFLRAIDNDKISGGSLIYINDDDIPELYIKSQSLDRSDMICFITKDGLSVDSINVSDSEGFWYLEKQHKILAVDVNTDRFNNSEDSESPTELHNGVSRSANLYFFSGDDLNYVYRLGRYVVDGVNYSNMEKDDGGYDYYDGEKDIPVLDVFEAVRGYFDIDKAKTPDISPIGELVEQVKGKRKNPDAKAGEYSGDISSLVSAYKEVSTSFEDYDENKTLTYRIPQINLNGEDIESINQEILDNFLDDANHIESRDNERTRYITVDYHIYSENGVLSLVIDGKGFGGTDSPDKRWIYTIDISAEKRISNVCLLNSYGVDCHKVAVAFDKKIQADYEAIKNDPNNWINDPDSGFEESTYEKLYSSTMERFSPVGEYNKMFFDNDGNLNILYLYKWVAGSEYYEKTMIIKKEEIE